jgi:AAA15 family ATPase/GTPase
MLIRFTVSNFLSFDEETVFDMLASSSAEHPDHVSAIGNVKVVKNAAIYGANGSGKSNLVLAIDKFISIIKKGELSENINTYKFKLNPKNKDLPVKFEMEFSIGNTMYLYGIECNNKTIEHEWLYDTTDPENDELLLERKTVGNRSYEIEFCQKWNETPEQKGINRVLKNNLLVDDQLVFHHHEILRIDELSLIHEYLSNTIIIIKQNFEPQSYFRLVRTEIETEAASDLIRKFDTGISSIYFDDIDLDSILADYKGFVEKYNITLGQKDIEDAKNIGDSTPKIITKDSFFLKIDGKVIFRKIFYNHKDEFHNDISFSLEEESDGTRKVINLLPIIIDQSIFDMVYIIDEIDNSLHPHLCYEFVKLLMSDRKENSQINYLDFTKRKRNSQIIFTTHQPNLLTRELFRDDEIWFVEKDKNKGNTSLYPLFEFDVKEGLQYPRRLFIGSFWRCTDT